MKGKRIGLLLLTTVCSFINMSCQKSDDITAISLKEFPETYQRITANINIDANIIIAENAEKILYSSKARRIQVNEEQLVEDLLGNNKQKEKIRKVDQWTYEDKNGQTLSLNKDAVAFLSSSDAYKEAQKEIEKQSLKDSADRIREVKTIEASRKNVELEELLISWGIENFELRDRLEADKTKCSAWCGYEKWQGLYVFSNKYYSGLSDEEAPLQIVEVSDNIEKMQLLYGYNFVKDQEPIKLQTFDNVADSIEKEYSMMITDNKHEVVSAELAFLVKDVHDQTDLDMEPVWVITIQEYKEGNRSEYSEYQEVYSAVTSKNVG